MSLPAAANLEAYRDALGSILTEWNQAERDIKIAEQVSMRVVEPSIKELRYAGRRVTEALRLILSDGADADIIKLLNDADFDCHRARHDAVDAATSRIASVIRAMVESIGYDTMMRVYPEFPKFYHSLRRTRRKIVDSREDRDNRDAIYESIEDVDLKTLVSDFEDIVESELDENGRHRRGFATSPGADQVAISLPGRNQDQRKWF